MGHTAKMPSMLVINPQRDIGAQLDSWLRQAFGNDFNWTVYSRPHVREHPRMRPYKSPEFEVILIDVAEWTADADHVTALERKVIPHWLWEDVLDKISKALVLVLSPQKAFQGVSFQYKQRLHDRADIVPREQAYWQTNGGFDTYLKDLWITTTRASEPKPSIWDPLP